MNLRTKLQRLERRARDATCRVCHNHGGRRMFVAWPGEPVDLAVETACRACGRCPPPEQVKYMDISDLLTWDLSPEELERGLIRATGRLPTKAVLVRTLARASAIRVTLGVA